jgi:hypothetical protein
VAFSAAAFAWLVIQAQGGCESESAEAVPKAKTVEPEAKTAKPEVVEPKTAKPEAKAPKPETAKPTTAAEAGNAAPKKTVESVPLPKELSGPGGANAFFPASKSGIMPMPREVPKPEPGKAEPAGAAPSDG